MLNSSKDLKHFLKALSPGRALTLFACAAFIIFFIVINILTLKDGHNWGDDFSQYIIHAGNILAGRPYDSGILVEHYVTYPPGFPLLLAPFLKIFGLNFVVLKILNVFFWFSALFFIYAILKKRVGASLSILTCLLFASSFFFFKFKQNILSDIPFFFMVWGSIWAFAKYDNSRESNQNNVRSLWLAISTTFMVCAFWVRSAGVLLFLAAFLFEFIIRRNIKVNISILAAFVLAFSLEAFLFGLDSTSGIHVVKPLSQGMLEAVSSIGFTARAIADFFYPLPNLFTSEQGLPFYIVLGWGAALVFSGLVVIFVKNLVKHSLAFEDCFAFLYAFFLLIWQSFYGRNFSPIEFTRYSLPLLPFVILYGAHYSSRLVKKFSKNPFFSNITKNIFGLLLAGLILCNIFQVAINFNFNDDVLHNKENQQLFEWMRENIRPDEHYLCWMARPLALLTGRVGAPLWIAGPHQKIDFVKRIHDLDISYLILSKVIDAPLIETFGKSPLFEPVWENDYYKILKVHREHLADTQQFLIHTK